MRRDTLIDFFDDLAAAQGEFLVHDDSFRTRTFSYGDIGRASRAFAARLTTAGIGKGDKVVIFSENRPEWIVGFWGCLLIGAVVVPIDYRSSPDFLVRVARIVDAKLLLVARMCLRSRESARRRSGRSMNWTGTRLARPRPCRWTAMMWPRSFSRPERRLSPRAC